MNEEERSNLYIYTYSDLDDDFVFAETKYTLGDLHKLQQENQQLKEEIERLKKELYLAVTTEEEMFERDHLSRYVEER